MKVYGFPGSTCTRAVLCALHEKGAPYEFVNVDLTKGEHKAPAHVARQPFGVIPSIDHDGFTLYESRAITRYLDEVLPGASLTPKDPKQRAMMEQWISVESSYFTPSAMKAILNIWFASLKGGQPDKDVVAAGVAGIVPALDVLDRALADKEHLCGAFSLADIAYAPYLQYLHDMGIAGGVTERRHVAAWWARVSARPSWQKAITQKV
ncbi:MAG: glutathione S-transferase N-terminal domain-containing protein [Polyangiaceae bacterium]|nr:glutathione S-transferase N-terminal domain-containing protein [Polyangiaceae bacterium]